MNTNGMTGPLREIAGDYDSVSQGLFELAGVMERVPGHDPAERLYSLVRSAEQDTLRLRNIAARTMGPAPAPFYKELASCMCISVEEEPKWVKITVPAILPNRSARDNSEYLMRPLRNSLIRFQRETSFPRFEDCMICIVHCYDEALSKRRVRDYDNIETKRYLDVIEAVLLRGDTGLLTSVLQTSELTDTDCTEFYLMQPETLGQWAHARIRTRT